MRRRITAIGLLLVTLTASTSTAFAHAEYVRSEPSSSALLIEPPTRVLIYFSQQLEMSMSSISVLGPTGQPASVGQAKVLPNDPRAMYVDLRPGLGPGTYTVRWSNMSAEDGEHANGQFTFTVGARPSLPTTGSGLPLQFMLATAVGLALLGTLVVAVMNGGLGRWH